MAENYQGEIKNEQLIEKVKKFMHNGSGCARPMVFDETKQPLTLEKSGNCSSAAPNTLDTIAILFH